MVEAAVSGFQPGVSKADLEATIAAQAGAQMTAADVKTVVDAAIRALPAPKVDPESIRPMIQDAVTSAVPKGTTAEEIRIMVMAAVTASTANVPTRGELEDTMAKAVADATKGQLTARQVQVIVDASVGVMTAQVRADLTEVRGSVEALAALPTPTALGARPGFKRVVLAPYMTQFASFIKRDPSRTLIKDQTLYTVEEGRPQQVDCHDRGAQYTHGWYCIAPIKLKKDGTLAEGLAVSYEVDDAGLTYILNLHPDAIYHNGRPLTARDVKEGWEWVSMPENRGADLGVAEILQQIEGMDGVISGDRLEASGLTVVDDHTLKMKLAKFDPLWPLKLSDPRMGAFDTQYVEANPDTWVLDQVGTGPYKTKFNPDTGEANWFATSNWWGDPPIIQHINMLPSDDLQNQYILFENGEADIIQAAHTQQAHMWVPGHKYFNTLYKHFWGGYWFFSFLNKPPFEDVKVREALIRAIDIEKVVKAVVGISAEVGAGIIVPGVRCNDPSVTGVKGYDPEKARQLLAESSYRNAESLPPIFIEVKRETFVRQFEIFQQYWKDELGVTVGVVHLQRGMARSPESNMHRGSVGTAYNDPARIIRTLGHSEGYWPTRTDFSDPELDAMIEVAESYSIQDPARCPAYRAVEDRMISTLWQVPLFMIDGTQAAREWVNDYGTYESPYPWMSISPRTGARTGEN